MIEFAEDFNEHFPTYTYEVEGSVREILDKYDNDTFWDELIERLVDRDIEKEWVKKNILNYLLKRSLK